MLRDSVSPISRNICVHNFTPSKFLSFPGLLQHEGQLSGLKAHKGLKSRPNPPHSLVALTLTAGTVLLEALGCVHGALTALGVLE